MFIHGRDEPYRPEFVVWMELPDHHVVGHAVVMPEDTEGAVARTLRRALTQPAAGSPRQPDVIRVSDAAIAAEVRAEVAGTIPVKVAPTPELDEFLKHMQAAMPEVEGGEASYFAGGHVSPAAVEKLFTAAFSLFAIKPWTVADDTPVLRMDIPALGVDGACLSIIGQLDESRGVLIFTSLDDFEQFLEATEPDAIEHGSSLLGTELLALTFEAATVLPSSMRREAMEHGWAVASADAYPLVERRGLDGAPRPLVERDVEIAAACALSLSAFFAKHAAIFKSDTFAPVCESHFDDDDREVRFTVPYEAFTDFDLAESVEPEFDTLLQQRAAEPFRPWVGRNTPCPCGSGRKYKKCHLADDEAEHARLQATAHTHAIDEQLLNRLSRFALQAFGPAWEAFEDDFADPDEAMQLALPWSVYCFEVEGTTVVDAYLDARGRRCSQEERSRLDAQRAAWLSVWEVEDIEPGKTLTLHDLLSGERRTVQERGGAQVLIRRDALLARVVDHDGVSLVCGTHPRPLSPIYTAEVVRRARGRLRRKRAVPVERLRAAAFGRHLIRYWEETIAVVDARGATPPDLRNRDGDPLLITVDDFEVMPGAMAEVEARIAEIDDAEKRPHEDSAAYVILRPDAPLPPDGDPDVLGWVQIAPTVLQVGTNSQARADALRERIEAACGTCVRHRARKHLNPLALLNSPGKPPPEPMTTSPEQARRLAEMKMRHYTTWLDQPLPALNLKTPRQCVQTAAGRAEVDLLLKHMEHLEQRFSDAPVDFSILRRELGIATR